MRLLIMSAIFCNLFSIYALICMYGKPTTIKEVRNFYIQSINYYGETISARVENKRKIFDTHDALNMDIGIYTVVRDGIYNLNGNEVQKKAGDEVNIYE